MLFGPKKEISELMSEQLEQSEDQAANPSRRGFLLTLLFVLCLLGSNAGTGWLAFTRTQELEFSEIERDKKTNELSQILGDLELTKKTRDALNLRLENIKQRQQDLTKSLIQAKNRYGQAQTQLTSFGKRQESLTKSLSEARAQLEATELSKKGFKRQTDLLKEQLESAETLQQKLRQEVAAARDESRAVAGKLKEASLEMKQLRRSVSNLDSYLLRLWKEHKINYRRRLGLEKVPVVNAQVISKFVRQGSTLLIINAGAREKILPDDLLYITRNGILVGEARVVELAKDKKSRCMARVVEVKKNQKVEKGDSISTLPPNTGM
ncbi:MAG: hypothetical protein P1V97_39525 [Planctomycetota bacterium]|nr:hypothetical protein [Planctomycetota bacterium]